MFKLCVLASTSKGNATYVRIGSTSFLIDAGISARKITKRLEEIGENVRALDGIVVSHEHDDHIKGIKTLTKNYGLKCYLNYETYAKISKKTGPIDAEFIDVGEEFVIQGVEILPYEIPHDGVNPLGFRISYQGEHLLGYICDCGFPSPYVLDGLRNVKILIIEANHSFDMLLGSDYPEHLKYRLLGSKGHLSNWQAAEFIRVTQPSIAVLAHISEKNNTPETALQEIQFILDHENRSFGSFLVVYPPEERSALIQW
ncbi:MAG: MBL fold metallo-hydrolase [Candidatus Heimdallarchaeota archaeon]